ncbi:MAG: polysaccharide deacetylase family protein [Gemmatimonadota bacterium]|nr:polysaccharide deacetylase family protein [Gemmatimonadota bacterium]
MKKGHFIISLDCEGKWGMADKLAPHWKRDLTNDRLIDAYTRLVSLLARHGIKATFAFVGAFTMSAEEARENPSWFSPHLVGGQDWLKQWRHDMERGNSEGWFVPELVEIVRSHGVHELGTHGFRHIPLDERTVSEDVFVQEIEHSRIVAGWRGYTISTLIYPRNRIGHAGRLRTLGLVGYRDALAGPSKGLARQIGSLAAEINVFTSPQPDARPVAGIVPIPAGHFLNWRFGARRYVPASVTIRRWRHMLDEAGERGGVVHLWSHPHNFINGDRMYEMFDAILETAAESVRGGRLENVTQHEYSTHALRNQH